MFLKVKERTIALPNAGTKWKLRFYECSLLARNPAHRIAIASKIKEGIFMETEKDLLLPARQESGTSASPLLHK